MLGLGKLTVVECESCKRGWSLKPEEIKLLNSSLDNLNAIIKCQWCDSEFSYLDGIINDMVSNNNFSGENFISDIFDGGKCEIIVGQENRFKFNNAIPVVNGMNVTCSSGFAQTSLIVINENEFTIVSSHVEGGVELGEKLLVYWSVSGRSS